MIKPEVQRNLNAIFRGGLKIISIPISPGPINPSLSVPLRKPPTTPAPDRPENKR